MKKNIKSADIQALLKLIVPEDFSIAIFDPFLRIDHPEELPASFLDTGKKALINLGGELKCFKQYRLEEFDIIIDFGKCDSQHAYIEKLHCKTNHSGEMRWLFKPNNLKFITDTYSANNLRSKLIKFGILSLSYLRLGRLFSNLSFTIRSNSELPYQNYVKTMDEAIIFMGTPGYQRKLTLAHIQEGRVERFVKIPLNLSGEKNVINEKISTDFLEALHIASFSHPKQTRYDAAYHLIQENQAHFTHQSNEFLPQYQRVLQELFEKTQSSRILWNTPLVSSVQQNLDILNGRLNGTYAEHVKLINTLFNSLNKSQRIETAFAHGDFTPWNLKHNTDEAYVFDWEYGRKQMPLLYDAIHFVIQSQVYTQQTNTIRLNQLIAALHNSSLNSILQATQHPTLYVKLYVMHQLSYHLTCVYFNNQVSEGLHRQLRVLFTLGAEILREEGLIDYRSKFLLVLADFLKRSKGYALMKFNLLNLSELPETSDIDILVDRSFHNELISFIKKLGWKVQLKSVERSFMTQLSIQFFDGSILYIDLIRKFKRKATLFMDSQEVLEKVRKLPSGLAVPQPEHDFEYAFLFYNLNGENIPHKYHSFFSAGGHFKSRILKYMGAKYLLTSSSFEDLFKLDKEGRAWLKMIVRHRSIQQPISFLSNRIHYGLDLLKTMRKDRGFIITFSGVDGSGKSTIIDRFKNELRTIHRKEVVLLRHRPRLLPILSAMKYGGVKAAEQRAGEIQPRKGKAKAGLGSALRFCYYYTDYLIGQSYIYFKYILRGKIVLYDRYYFDFIVDAKRSNITMPPKLVKQLYTLIYKPKYNFLLWSNPEAVYQRKPEVEIEQISSLNQGYKVLFKELEHTAKHATYRIVHNQQIDSTVKQILRECREVA